MLSLQDREWQPFYFRKIFTEIKRGRRLKTADHRAGAMPYVSSSAVGNGVDNFISNNQGVRVFHDCLTVANSGSVGRAFYHRYSFVASDHVTELKNPLFSQRIYLFLLPVVSRLAEKYSFNREINDSRINKEILLLPVNQDNEPDWQFMEEYIREREQLLLQKYIAFAEDSTSVAADITPLAEKEWREFFVGDVVTIEAGRNIGGDERVAGLTPYISASAVNNGVSHFVGNSNATKEAGCLSVNSNGSVGYAFYHSYEALYSNDCRKLRLKKPSKYVGVFIAHQITAQRDKYSYGYKVGTGRLRRQMILLPATVDGEPDWEYMEQYVKAIMRQQMTSYLTRYRP